MLEDPRLRCVEVACFSASQGVFAAPMFLRLGAGNILCEPDIDVLPRLAQQSIWKSQYFSTFPAQLKCNAYGSAFEG